MHKSGKEYSTFCLCWKQHSLIVCSIERCKQLQHNNTIISGIGIVWGETAFLAIALLRRQWWWSRQSCSVSAIYSLCRNWSQYQAWQSTAACILRRMKMQKDCSTDQILLNCLHNVPFIHCSHVGDIISIHVMLIVHDSQVQGIE